MDTGIETSGSSLNWRNLNTNREEDFIISSLMKEAKNIYIEKPTSNETTKINLDDIIFKEFNLFLKKNKLSEIFTKKEIKESETLDKKKNKKKKEKTISKKDALILKIEEDNKKKKINN